MLMGISNVNPNKNIKLKNSKPAIHEFSFPVESSRDHF